jgi:hypothetical protein
MKELNWILEISRSWIILNFKLVELYGYYGDVQPAMTRFYISESATCNHYFEKINEIRPSVMSIATLFPRIS